MNEHAEELCRDRQLTTHRPERRQCHDDDDAERRERVAEEARVVRVDNRLGEGACDRGRFERNLESFERGSDLKELAWPIYVDVPDGAVDLP